MRWQATTILIERIIPLEVGIVSLVLTSDHLEKQTISYIVAWSWGPTHQVGSDASPLGLRRFVHPVSAFLPGIWYMDKLIGIDGMLSTGRPTNKARKQRSCNLEVMKLVQNSIAHNVHLLTPAVQAHWLAWNSWGRARSGPTYATFICPKKTKFQALFEKDRFRRAQAHI